MTTAVASTWGYTTANGKIYDPNGNQFVAHGINVGYDYAQPSAAQILATFPGTNFVRLAIQNYDSPQSMQAYVNDLTSHGIVVEIENHYNGAGNYGGSQGAIFTGTALQQEQAWFNSIASYFSPNGSAPNNKVWFGTNNEPTETDANGNSDPAGLSAWQQTTYNTIRATGNTSPVLLEANGWAVNGQAVMNQGYNPSDYAGMINTIWDIHDYGWVTNYSTDQATNSNFLGQMVASAHTITGAGGGTMPIIIGEFGNSTTGVGVDANGAEVVQAVTQGADTGVTSGYVAWAWGTGNPGDGLTDGNGNASVGYGQLVAAAIQKTTAAFLTATTLTTTTLSAAATPTPTPTSGSPTSAVTATVAAANSPVITDSAGDIWTITSAGTVAKNNSAAGFTANVVRLADVNGVVWQQNATGGWWGWDGKGWNLGNGTTTDPVPSASANNTVLTGTTGSVTDATGNQWSISKTATVVENGTAAGYSVNVKELAYVNGIAWQENSAGGWWGWSGTGWTLGGGTTTSPLPPVASANDSVVKAGATATIADASGNQWGITNAGLVSVNGIADTSTVNVAELAYVDGKIWQENTSNLWWSKTLPTDAWNAPTGTYTSPLSSSAAVQVTNGTGVTQSIAAVTAAGITAAGDTFILKGGLVQATFGSAATNIKFLGSTSVIATGGSGATTVIAQAGTDKFIAGKGTLNVTGGTGADNYVFHAGSGLVTIADFSAAKGDTLTIDKSLHASMTEKSDAAGGTMLGFNGHSGIDLHNVTTMPTSAIHFI